jgi:hypothetical protein
MVHRGVILTPRTPQDVLIPGWFATLAHSWLISMHASDVLGH